MGETETLRDHVIIAGYGWTGQKLARSLEEIGILYLVVDLNSDNVRDAARQGMPAFFGDVTSAEVLEHLGAADASELVIAINDPDATARATRAARLTAPNLRISTRTAYRADVSRLEKAGATYVIDAETAAADAIVDRVLSNLGVRSENVSETQGS